MSKPVGYSRLQIGCVIVAYDLFDATTFIQNLTYVRALLLRALLLPTLLLPALLLPALLLPALLLHALLLPAPQLKYGQEV